MTEQAPLTELCPKGAYIEASSTRRKTLNLPNESERPLAYSYVGGPRTTTAVSPAP